MKPSKALDILDIFYGVILIILALKLSPAIGVFGTLAFVCAGVKIALTAIGNRVWG